MEEGVYNIFMVGDVKQSAFIICVWQGRICLWRILVPPREEGGKQLRIDLHKNFRSRKEVLGSVNYLFYQIMGEDLGGVRNTTGRSSLCRAGVSAKTEAGNLVASQDGQEAAALPPATEVLLLEEDDPVWKGQ